MSRGKVHLGLRRAAWQSGSKGLLEVWKRECSQSSQPSLFPRRLYTPEGLSHDPTVKNRGQEVGRV